MKNTIAYAFYKLGKTYLESNAAGLCDGALKAGTHRQLCELFISVRLEVNIDIASIIEVEGERLSTKVRKATVSLTDYLDEVIGFPIDTAPNYKRLTPAFVGKFFTLAQNWFDENTFLLSDREVIIMLERVTKNNISHALPALESYGFEFVDGTHEEGKSFLTMRSKIGQVVTVKPNKYFGCSFKLDNGIEP